MGAATAVVMLVATAGCGGGESSITSTNGRSAADSGSAEEFMAPSGENKYAEFGQEASASEREAASKVLAENLKARAAGDWARQCASLTPQGIKNVETEAPSRGLKSGCAQSLKALAEPLSTTAPIRANTMSGPIAALRVEGSKGYALYHGSHGNDYTMSMERVNGSWKVNALVTIEVP